MDPLEDRLRDVLSGDGWRLPADPDALGRIHLGAIRRRRQRTALHVAAGVTLLLGGAGAAGLIASSVTDSPTEIATGDAEQDAGASVLSTAEPRKADDDAESVPRSGEETPPASPEQMDGDEDETPLEAQNDGTPVPPEFRAISMTAADSQTFWVLGGELGSDSSAVVARSDDGGATFDLVGTLDDVSAVSGENARDQQTVREIRFADNSSGWAFGDGLWTTRDGGTTWSRVGLIEGDVQQLETAGGRAYALVRDAGQYSLWKSPAAHDEWARATITLTEPSDLAAAGDLVAIADRTADGTSTVVSTDAGESFQAPRDSPCFSDLSASQLAATSGSLWLSCATGTSVGIHVSHDEGETWKSVDSDRPVSASGMEVGPKDEAEAVAAGPNEIVILDQSGSTRPIEVDGMETPASVYFSDPETGYVLDHEGALFRSADGGESWDRLEFN